jgi:hypothetical protein
VRKDERRPPEGDWEEIRQRGIDLEQCTEMLVRREDESNKELLERACEGRYSGYEKQEVEAIWKRGGIEVRCRTVQRLDGDVVMADITETREETYVKAGWEENLEDCTWELQSRKPWQEGGLVRRQSKDDMRIPVEHSGQTHELRFEGTPTRGGLERAAERVIGVSPLTAAEHMNNGVVHMDRTQTSTVTVKYMDWGEHPQGMK